MDRRIRNNLSLCSMLYNPAPGAERPVIAEKLEQKHYYNKGVESLSKLPVNDVLYMYDHMYKRWG